MAAQRAGHTVTALVRNPRRARGQLGAEVELVELADPAAIQAAVSASDAIINLAGENILGHRWSARRKRELHDSRVGVTRQLVEAIARRSSALPVLVSASAIGVYGDQGDRVVDEKSPAGDDFTARLCRDWEAAAEAARPHATRVVCARLGIVLGGEGGALATMRPLFRLGLGGRVGSGAQWVSWVHLEDAAAAVLLALTEPRIDGAMNVVAGAVQNRDFAAALGKAMARPAVMPAPGFALRLVLGERAAVLLGSQRVEPAVLRSVGFSFAYPTLGQALAEALDSGRADVSFTAPTGPAPASEYLAKRPARYQLAARTVIARPLEEVFAFFSAAANLGAITPPDMGFSITSELPSVMSPGTVIDYQIRAAGLPMSWRTVIDAWEPSTSSSPAHARFVDSQARGPYACWWHEHRFVRDGERTVMEDRVLYTPPLWLLGRLANTWMIRGELRRIFAHRARAIRLRFGLPA
jgi:uncharacterized protein